MKNRPLAQGTRVHVGSILITEKFGNMQIASARSPSNIIVVERADVDDFAIALSQHLAKGISARVGSILVNQTSDGLRIMTTHTPSNAITIVSAAIDDLTAAVRQALKHLV